MIVNRFRFSTIVRKFQPIRCLTQTSQLGPSDSKPTTDKPKQWKKLSVDISALGSESAARLFADKNDSTSVQMDNKEPKSPLAAELLDYVKISGPISLHEYMSQAANHLVHGYYQHDKKKIGEKGDFITAPEISQLFGEMLSVWCIAIWENLGCPSNIRIIELGPGNGTLMSDMIRTLSKNSSIKNCLDICFVELSESLRSVQQTAVDCDPNSIETNLTEGVVSGKTNSGIQLHWYKFVQQLPRDNNIPCIFIGQEFLDAFPVHQFVQTSKGWREKLVDIDTSPESPYYFRTVLAAGETPALKVLMQAVEGQTANSPTSPLFIDQTRFRKSQKKSASSPSPNPAYGNGNEATDEINGVEISPRALAICESVANIISKCRGAALFIDYGEDYCQGDSIRAFKAHKQVHILSEPGLVDVTADVDFAMCSRVAARQPNIRSWPVLTQGQFLLRMGITDRTEALIEHQDTTDEQAQELLIAFKRLVGSQADSPTYMGSRFKVLSFTDKATNSPGFE